MGSRTRVDSERRRRQAVAEDDSFFHHARSDSPWWNESAWFGFMIPERKIDAYFYMWHRPNMGLTAGGVALWDSRGEEKHNCLYQDWYDFNPLREGSDMFDYELSNGMRCELLEPLQRYRLRYDSEPCEIDLVWEGAHPAQVLHFPDGGFEQFGGFHYEQLGRVTGSVRVEGEMLQVDCHHVRDRSWGVRARHRRHPGGGLEMGWASERSSFCVTMIRPDPRADLTSVSVDRPGYGQLVKDGEVGLVVSGERRVVERRADGAPLRIIIDIKDDLGREMHAEGRTENVLKWDDIWFVHWGLVNWVIDGRPGWGETQDWIEQDLLRAHQRGVLKQRPGFAG